MLLSADWLAVLGHRLRPGHTLYQSLNNAINYMKDSFNGAPVTTSIIVELPFKVVPDSTVSCLNNFPITDESSDQRAERLNANENGVDYKAECTHLQKLTIVLRALPVKAFGSRVSMSRTHDL